MVKKVWAWAVVLGLAGVAWAGEGPRVFSCKGEDLQGLRERYRKGEEGVVKLIKEGVIARADEAMKLRPMSVMDKEFTPPTGDKHDYMSLSPYWWRDPNKADGLPYVRRDGEFNPERAKYDEIRFNDLSEGVFALGLGYYFSGHADYAKHARDLLVTWYLAPETCMRPNLEFAQFVPGYTETRASGVIEGRKTIGALDAIGLISESGVWTKEDDEGMHKWVGEMLKYLLTSKQGHAEQRSPNNHGTWYGVQVATYALYLGEKQQARELLEKYVRDRVKSQFEPDGAQPLELARTNGILYVRFNILAHEDGAMLGERVGLDLWNYEVDGRSMRKGLDWLMPYVAEGKKWEWKQISPVKKKETAVVYRRAARAYHDARYEEAVQKINPGEGIGALGDVMYPAEGR